MKKYILSLACIGILETNANELNLLEISRYSDFYYKFFNFASISNPNGAANAIRSYGRTLYLDHSSFEFGNVNARDEAAGIRGNFLSSISFSSGFIGIENITSSQSNAYGIVSDSNFKIKLYHGIFGILNASLDFGAIEGELNAYGLKANGTLTIKGSGWINSGEIDFRGMIDAKRGSAYGVDAKVFKLNGTILRFHKSFRAQQDVYGIKADTQTFIQESEISFLDFIAKQGKVVGVSVGEDFVLQNEEMSDKASSVSFGAIQGDSAYGISDAMPQTSNFRFRNSKIYFQKILGINGAYGIYNQDSNYVLEDNFFNHYGGELHFDLIASSNGEAIGIHNASGNNTITLSSGVIGFDSIRGKSGAYGIKGALNLNTKTDAIHPAKRQMFFSSIIAEGSNAYGHYVDSGASILSLTQGGVLKFDSITAPLGQAYGLYATGGGTIALNLDGSLFQVRLEGNGEIFHSEVGSKIDLAMEDRARLVLDGDGGKIDSLEIGMNSWGIGGNLIDLSGAYGDVGVRSRKESRTLEIANYRNNSSHTIEIIVGLYANPYEGIADRINIPKADGGYENVVFEIFYHPSDLKQPPKQAKEIVIASLGRDLKVDHRPGYSSEAPEVVQSRVKMGFDDVVTRIHRRDSSTYGIYNYVINTAEKPKFSVNTEEAVKALELYGVAYGLHFYNLGQISKRLGTLRKGYDRGGVWAHTNAGMGVCAELDIFSAFAFEAGGDFGFNFGDWVAYVGGNFTYSRVFKSDVNDMTQDFEGGIYGALANAKGFYYYAQLKTEYFDSTKTRAGYQISSIDQIFLTLSQEVGYRIDVGKFGGFYWEPKTQLDLSISLPSLFSQTHQDNTLRSTLKTGGIVNIRLGADLGYSFLRSSGLKSDLYFGMYYGMNSLFSGGVSFESDFSHSAQEIPAKLYHNLLFSLGSHIEASKNLKLFMDLDFGVGGGFFPVAKGSFGAKYVF